MIKNKYVSKAYQIKNGVESYFKEHEPRYSESLPDILNENSIINDLKITLIFIFEIGEETKPSITCSFEVNLEFNDETIEAIAEAALEYCMTVLKEGEPVTVH